MASAFDAEPGGIVGRLLHDIADYEIFQASLAAYARVAVDINAHHSEDGLAGAAVAALDAAATGIVAAAANYHCAHTLFDVLKALDHGEKTE
jgi:hypothetical protein